MKWALVFFNVFFVVSEMNAQNKLNKPQHNLTLGLSYTSVCHLGLKSGFNSSNFYSEYFAKVPNPTGLFVGYKINSLWNIEADVNGYGIFPNTQNATLPKVTQIDFINSDLIISRLVFKTHNFKFNLNGGVFYRNGQEVLRLGYFDSNGFCSYGDYIEYNSIGLGGGTNVNYTLKNRIVLGIDIFFTKYFENSTFHTKESTQYFPNYKPQSNLIFFNYKLGVLLF